MSEIKILEARFKVSISRQEYEKTAYRKDMAQNGRYMDLMMGTLWWQIYIFEDVGAMKAQMDNLREMEQAVDYVNDLKDVGLRCSRRS